MRATVGPVLNGPEGPSPETSHPAAIPPADGHRWVSLTDDAGDVWLFDADFLLSGYHCIYAQGSPSIGTQPDPAEVLGCCIHGAHFVDTDDRVETAAAAALLTDDNWQFRRRALRAGGPFKQDRAGSWMTRRTEGACIFLNRANFPGGGGCALHRGALEAGKRPLDWKPDVCWQVPIRLDVHSNEYGNDTVFVRAWERRNWGPGGEHFHWWCIEQPEAHTASEPVYLTSRDELIELVGPDLYARLADALNAIERETPVTLR